MSKRFELVVCGYRGEKFTIDLCKEHKRNMTVLLLKDKIAQRLSSSTELRLIFKDKMLDRDDALLSDYGIQHMSKILIVMKLPGGGRMAPRPPDPLTP